MPKVKQFNRNEVLSAAAQIFQTKGYNGTSIDEILKATGLSRSSLYDSFNDKHSLYLQSLEFYKTNQEAAFGSVDKKEMNGLEKIEFLFKEAVNHLINHPKENGCLMVNAAAEMSKLCIQTSEIICNNKENLQDIFSEWLSDAQNKKLLHLSKPVKSYSAFLFNALCGLKVLSQSGASKNELLNVAKVTIEALH
ncbi:MAG: TetR/AcrR family transcriptional regulator [Bacteroidota bacterium]